MSGVIFAHAAGYRFGEVTGWAAHAALRLAGPVAELGVQLFFVISGYIITSLLLREEVRSQGVNVLAFFARRSLRILPPLFAFLAILVALRSAGYIAFADQNLVNSALFTCNTGFTQCDWWVAHTWSLAVEEQYYLCWPLLFVHLPPRLRPAFLTVSIAVLLAIFLWLPPAWHSNFISFACIATGALYATSGLVQTALQKIASPFLWVGVVGVLILGPLGPAAKAVEAAIPFLVLYVLFAAREIDWVMAILESRPLQILGASSYSLYLWQQLFLAKPGLYLHAPLPLLFLVMATAASVFLVEKPSIRAGHKISAALNRRRDAARGAQSIPTA